MCVDGMDGWKWVKTRETIIILMNLHRKTTAINRSFALPLHTTFHKAKQSIGWEPLASTNRTDNCLIGSEPEYDYQGDGWED